MSYCPHCGSEVNNDFEHCPDCGKQLSSPKNNTTSQESNFTIGRKLALGGVMIVGFATFLPWVSISVLGTTDSVSGLNTLGFITLILAVIAGLVIFSTWSSGAQTLAFLAGIGIVGVAGYGISDPAQLVEIQSSGIDEGLIQPGIGMYATLMGGILLLIASGYRLSNEDQPTDDTDDEPSFFTLYWLPGFSK